MNITQKTYNEIDCFDLDDKIKEYYGHKYYVAASLESGNNAYHVIRDQSTEDHSWDTWGAEKFEKFKTTGVIEGYGGGLLYYIIEDLIKAGEIPSGDYLISVSW